MQRARVELEDDLLVSHAWDHRAQNEETVGSVQFEMRLGLHGPFWIEVSQIRCIRWRGYWQMPYLQVPHRWLYDPVS